jgi:hypothetical protein
MMVIENIITHKPVKNSFHLQVKLKELEQPEWIKKVDIQNLVIYKDYVNSLPNKSLREKQKDNKDNPNYNKPPHVQRHSKRLTKEPDRLRY